MNTKDIATFEARVEGVSETLTSINNIKEKVSDLKQETLELRNEKARQDAQIKINQDTLAKYSRAMAEKAQTNGTASPKPSTPTIQK